MVDKVFRDRLDRPERRAPPAHPASSAIPASEGQRAWPVNVDRLAGYGAVGVLPSERRSLLSTLHEQIDNIYRELDVQMKRMAQLQVQLDDVRKRMYSLASDSN